jgi:stringent starvation protein B
MAAELPLKPFLVRAVYDWALEAGATPQIVVDVSVPGVQVPAGIAKDGQVVLNIHPQAVSGFHFDRDGMQFQARFQGRSEYLIVPIAAIRALFSRETGQGMTFEVDSAPPPETPAPADGAGARPARPVLRRVK